MSDTLSKEQRKFINGVRKSRKEFAYTPPADILPEDDGITVLDGQTRAAALEDSYDEDDARPANEETPAVISPLPASQSPTKKHAYADPGATGYNKKPVKRTYQPAKQNGKGNGKASKPSQYRDPKINVLDKAMMEIIENRPLRGRVKFFDSRPEKAFGFIIVDSLEATPVGLYTGQANRCGSNQTDNNSSSSKEVFFHYNDVGRVDWIGNQHSYPIITLRRDLEDYEPAYPQANDRVVFFPIEVLHSHGVGTDEVRAKAVPWAYEQDWDDAYAAMVEAEHFRYLRVTRSKSLAKKETRSIQWFGSEHEVEEFLKSEEYQDCEEECSEDLGTKFQWQIWQPSDHEKVQLDYHEDPNYVFTNTLYAQWEDIQHPDE